MRTKLIAIGNSKGVRLPKAIVEQCNFGADIEMEVIEEGLLLRPRKRRPRQGWSEAIRAEIERGGELNDLDPDWERLGTDWDAEEWKW